MIDQSLENTVVRGTVRALTPDFATIEIAQGLSGPVALTEFGKPPAVSIGDAAWVLVEVLEEGKEPLLSKDKADQLRKWDVVVKAHAAGQLIDGTIVAPVKGGYSVDIGLRGFLPARHADLKKVRDPEEMIGEKLQFKILKLEDEDGQIVLSRRELLEKERDEQRVEREALKKARDTQKSETLAKLVEGKILPGKVKTVTDYGAFIDLGGVDGLLHVTEMSYSRVGHPRELVKVGDELQVMVLKVDEAAGRIALGLKQTQPDPWADTAAKLAPGTTVSGKVMSLTEYGAFVAIAPGVEGLIHVSEMSWTKRVTSPSTMLKVGEEVSAVVLDVDVKAKRVRLGMRQLAPNPWTQLEEQYPIGSVIRGRVRSVTDFGVFVGVQEGIDGLVHVSDLSWTQRIKQAGELYKKGDEVEAVVLDIDVPNERFSLGIKQLKPDPWSELAQNHPVGSVTKGKVTRVVDFGAFVELEPGIEGLVHVSQLAEERVERPSDVVKPGDELTVKVIDLDVRARKVALSVKAAQHEDYDYRETMRTLEQQGRSSLGEVLGNVLGERSPGAAKDEAEEGPEGE